MRFTEPFLIGKHSIEIGASLGISTFPEHGEDAEHLLGYADNAMYHSKQRGKNMYSVYNKHTVKD
jgi:diguanylate cyclase